MVDMAKRKSTAVRRPGNAYRLLDGRTIDLRGLTVRERAFLADLQKMGKADISYFEIERVAVGPGSPALGGRNRVDTRIAETPLYLAAEDIATRAGIEQGLVLAPEHEAKRAVAPSDGSMISVTQAAELIGVSRTAVYKAIEKGTLRATRIGNVTVVDRAFALAYREHRSAENGSGARAASAPKKGSSIEHPAHA
jgi:excisionase family DNA binding protein